MLFRSDDRSEEQSAGCSNAAVGVYHARQNFVVNLLAVSLLAAVGFAYAQVDGEITIGVFEPVTGENGGGGFQEVLGVRYANQVYPEITVGGKTYKINLFEVDNKSDKTEAVTAAQNLVSKNVTAVVGSYD